MIGRLKDVAKGSSMQQVKGVVALSKGAPVEVMTINVPDPGPGEVVVKVQACGVCHTDLHYREGGINMGSRSCWATRPRAWWSRWHRM